MAGAELNRAAIAERLDRGHLDATTLMEYLIRRGMPQRTAHGVVGKLVRKALDRGVRLADLSLDEFQGGRSRASTGACTTCLGAEHAVDAFVSYGSTAPAQVAEQLFALETKAGANPEQSDIRRL